MINCKEGIAYSFVLIFVLIHVKAVQHAMKCGGQEYAGYDQKNDAGIERINPGEDLARAGMQLIDRAHASQQHGCVQKCIHPGHAFDEMITQHAQHQRAADDGQHNEQVFALPQQKLSA